MKLDPGDLVLVPFPFTDLTSVKTRPALVLSNATYNASSGDVILCGVTSNLTNSAHSVLLQQRDMERGKLAATSRAKADKIVTLNQSIVRRKVGRVKATAFAQVMKEFETLFD